MPKLDHEEGQNKIDAFELWVWRKILIVSRTENKVRTYLSLEAITKMLKMRYFGHVMRAHQSLEKDIMLGITAGARKKGKPRMRWMEEIKSVTEHSVNDLNQLVKDRKK